MANVSKSISEINCVNCMHSKQVDDNEHYCYFPRDPEQRFEVDDSDFCGENGAWLVVGPDNKIIEADRLKAARILFELANCGQRVLDTD